MGEYWKYKVNDINGKENKGFNTLENAKKYAKLKSKNKKMFVSEVLGIYDNKKYQSLDLLNSIEKEEQKNKLQLSHFVALNNYLDENDLTLSRMEKEDFEMLNFEVVNDFLEHIDYCLEYKKK